MGDPRVSVVPVLDQWVREGKRASRNELQSIIKEMIVYKRFNHALEISQWMSDKRYIPLQISDIAIRLSLIQRVKGLEQAESYFNIIPQDQKGFNVYNTLLSCYARENSLEKAESLMQKLRNLGFATTPLSYNLLMNLYYQSKDWEKMDALMNEMEEKGIGHDKFTLSIRLSAYVSASDIEGVDKIMGLVSSDHKKVVDCDFFCVAADGYLKLGQMDKAMALMKKVEGLIITSKRPAMSFHLLLKLYGKAGNKEELFRFWSWYKENEKIYNKGYKCMMSSLMKFDDVEGAEKILEEWESANNLSYDFSIPNFLIDAYCKNGFVDKAKALVFKGISRGGTPTARTWYCLANGYLINNQVPKAVEALVKAITGDTYEYDMIKKDKLVTCLEYLEGKGDVDRVDEFISSLRAEGLFSEAVHEKLLNYIKDNDKRSTSSQTK